MRDVGSKPIILSWEATSPNYVQVFTGQPPYHTLPGPFKVITAIVGDKSPESDDAQGIPDDISIHLRSCWDRDPDKRPSIDALHDSLGEALSRRLQHGVADPSASEPSKAETPYHEAQRALDPPNRRLSPGKIPPLTPDTVQSYSHEGTGPTAEPYRTRKLGKGDPGADFSGTPSLGPPPQDTLPRIVQENIEAAAAGSLQWPAMTSDSSRFLLPSFLPTSPQASAPVVIHPSLRFDAEIVERIHQVSHITQRNAQQSLNIWNRCNEIFCALNSLANHPNPDLNASAPDITSTTVEFEMYAS